MVQDMDEKISILMVGGGGCGKSNILLRFIQDIFDADWDPTITDSYMKTISVDGLNSVLEIIDVSCTEVDCWSPLWPLSDWMTNRDAYIFVYSMEKESTLNDLDHWFKLYENLYKEQKVKSPIIIVIYIHTYTHI